LIHPIIPVFVGSIVNIVKQEVVNVTLDVLKSMQKTLGTFELEFTELDWGTARYKKTGKYMPDDGLDILRTFDAGLFGAVGAPGTNPHILACLHSLHFIVTYIIADGQLLMAIPSFLFRRSGPHLSVESTPSHPRAHAVVCKCAASKKLSTCALAAT
jgi:hypothetical protein